MKHEHQIEPGQDTQHIVQVLERRDQDMSKDRQKLAARQAIRQRKSDDQWQEWVRQQRDKTYVEYHLEDK
jgi:peptidyl-prolyl cis-trans isomerase SurA